MWFLSPINIGTNQNCSYYCIHNSIKLQFTKINHAIKSLLLQNRQKMLRKQIFLLITIIVQFFGSINAQESTFELKTVVIDAGHGEKTREQL